MPATIFSGSNVKTLKSTIDINGGAQVLSSATDPTSVAVSAPIGSLLLNTTNGSIYSKLDAGSSTNWTLYSGTAGTGFDSSLELSNLGLSASVAGNALTINLVTSSGATPSALSPVRVAFRNATAGTGQYSRLSVTGSLSFTVSSGSTLGHQNGLPGYIYVYLVNNSGTPKLAVMSGPFIDEGSVQTTVAEGGAGNADSNRIFYSDAAYSNVPVRLIGRMKSTQTTAGTWTAVPTEISVAPFYVDNVVARYTTAAGQSFTNASAAIVDFGTRDFDPYFCVTTGGSWNFRAPTAGKYNIKAYVTFASASFPAGTELAMTLQKSGVTQSYVYRKIVEASLTNIYALYGSDVINMANGDTCDIIVSQNSGGSRSLAAFANSNYIHIERIGA